MYSSNTAYVFCVSFYQYFLIAQFDKISDDIIHFHEYSEKSQMLYQG